MTTAKEREDFIALMVAEFCQWHSMGSVAETARALLRHARTHGNLAVEECNGPPEWMHSVSHDAACASRMHSAAECTCGKADQLDQWQAGLEKRQERVEKRIREICASLGVEVHLGGDPRGYTVKLKLPSGAYNTWGGSEEGYGVPQ